MFKTTKTKNQILKIPSKRYELKTTSRGELGYQFFKPICIEVS